MRYHGLDLLRAAMMFLGVVLHAGVMYMPFLDEMDILTFAEHQRDPFRDVSGYNMTAQRIVWVIHFFACPPSCFWLVFLLRC